MTCGLLQSRKCVLRGSKHPIKLVVSIIVISAPPRPPSSRVTLVATHSSRGAKAASYYIHTSISTAVRTLANENDMKTQGASRSGRFRPLRSLTRSQGRMERNRYINGPKFWRKQATCNCQEPHAPQENNLDAACTYDM